MKRLLAAVIASLALPAIAQDKFTLQLNWFHLADHSPIYLALKKGYYKEENIELTVVRGSGSADSAKKIDLKQGDAGISDAPTVLTAISKGADLRMVAVVFDKAGNNAFFKKSANIRSPKDLVGKKIAVPPADSHRVLWPAFAAINKLDVSGVTLQTPSIFASLILISVLGLALYGVVVALERLVAPWVYREQAAN